MATMLDIGLLVIGSALVGLAAAVLADGLDLFDLNLGLSTAGLLGSALVLAITGAFAIGVAAEGPGGRGARPLGHTVTEVAIARLLAVLVVGIGLILLGDRLEALTSGLPTPLRRGGELIGLAGATGMIAISVVGVPLTWALARNLERFPWAGQAELPLFYVLWALATWVMT